MSFPQTMALQGRSSVRSQHVRLTADRLDLFFFRGSGRLKRVEARGDVRVEVRGGTDRLSCEGEGERATFDARTGVVDLAGWPRVVAWGETYDADTPQTRFLLNSTHIERIEPGSPRGGGFRAYDPDPGNRISIAWQDLEADLEADGIAGELACAV